jgi:hypothetical protein
MLAMAGDCLGMRYLNARLQNTRTQTMKRV